MDRVGEATGRFFAPQRIVILRALALGDLLCAVPTLRALRRVWPRAHTALIGLPATRQWARRFSHYIDDFVEFPGWPGLPELEPEIERIPEFLADMQRRRFDLAIQLHGSGTIVNSLVALLGARRAAGFYPPGYYCPDPATFVPWPAQGLEIHRLLTLVDGLGIERDGDELEFPLATDDFAKLRSIATARRLFERPYIVIHPGASTPLRRWPIENFAAVADELIHAGYLVAVTGVMGERPLAAELIAVSPERIIDLTGRTDLGTLGAVVKHASLVLCNDTGISHVAAALHTPSVVISTSDNPARWAPINRRLHRVLCDRTGVTADQVWQAALEQLELRSDTKKRYQDRSVSTPCLKGRSGCVANAY